MLNWLKKSPQTEHEFCQENLSPFLDSRLAPREQKRVTRHLQECAGCRADLQSLRQTVVALRAVPMVKPPRSFFIPASEGVRQRQAQRNRVAYGYLQFATAVAMVLLVLVVSGDVLLRLGVAKPAREQMAPTLELTAMNKGIDASEPAPTAAPAALTAVPAPQGLGAAPPQAAEPTAAPLLAQPPVPAATVAGSQELTVQALPSQTFARSAGAPLLPTVTLADEATASPAAEGEQPEVTAAPEAGATQEPEMPTAVPTETPVPPTATPLPTETPVPPTATPLPTQTSVPPTEQPSPQPPQVELQRQAPPPSAPASRFGFLRPMQPLLPWLEWILGALAAVLLVATLWLRRKQRAV